MRDLPTEIVFLIVDAINEFEERRKLLQVCRSWRDVLPPKVYSRVTLGSDESLVPLVYAARHNRSLAARVRELRVQDLSCKAEKFRLYDPDLFRELIKPFVVEPTNLSEWEDDLKSGEEEVWLVLALLSLENLQYFEMRHHSYCLDFILAALAQFASGAVCFWDYTPLSHLREVNLMSETKYQNFPAARFAPFFKLPSLRVFRAAGLHEEYEDDFASFPIPLDLKPKSSSVNKIILHHSNCRYGMIAYISSCANLEYFEYQHSNSANHGDMWLNFRPRQFHTALSTQKHSLRVLRLNDRGITKGVEDIGLEDEGISTGDDVEIEHLFGSLAKFTELRELRIPVCNLLDSNAHNHGCGSSLEDVLPGSLEYLCLARTDRAEFDSVNIQLRRLLNVKNKRFPALRKLVIQLYQMELAPGKEPHGFNSEDSFLVPHSTHEKFQDVKRMCEKDGVEFSFAHDGDHQVWDSGKLVFDPDAA